MILGADVGGTFTDLVLIRNGIVTTAKVPTTALQSDGIAEGATSIAGGEPIESFLHGTTVATNALLERTGARTVLITDEGFEDIIEIGRQDRPSLYDSFDDRATPLVSRGDRIGAGADVTALAPDLVDVEAVAIAIVNGHADPQREVEIERCVRALGFLGPISRSSVVAPEFREFERTSTTVLNAYLGPRSARYLDELDAAMVGSGIAEHVGVMQSSGGLTSLADAARNPAGILLSGPAGGVIATAAFADAHGHDRVISFDMGGTSTDVCRIEDGGFDVSYERTISGFVCRLPSAGIHTVGAGGGSVAWIDAGGSLRVGPHSAGANPGPACYGRGGTQPTVSDANVVLGRIASGATLGGSLTVDRTLAVSAMQPLADTLGLTVEGAALGIVTIAEGIMAQAIRKVSIEQGADPRGAFLYAFGGAGGLHASALARSLGMAGVVIPPHGGVFSALGLLLAPPRSDTVASVLGTSTNPENIARVARGVAELATTNLRDAGHSVADVEFVVDVRYLGQAHEIGVRYETNDSTEVTAARFHDAHFRRNGFTRLEDPIEIVTVRAAAFGSPALTMESIAPEDQAVPAIPLSRSVVFDSTVLDTAIVRREDLSVGEVIAGPAIIEESEATTVIGPDDTATILATGAMEVAW